MLHFDFIKPSFVVGVCSRIGFHVYSCIKCATNGWAHKKQRIRISYVKEGEWDSKAQHNSIVWHFFCFVGMSMRQENFCVKIRQTNDTRKKRSSHRNCIRLSVVSVTTAKGKTMLRLKMKFIHIFFFCFLFGMRIFYWFFFPSVGPFIINNWTSLNTHNFLVCLFHSLLDFFIFLSKHCLLNTLAEFNRNEYEYCWSWNCFADKTTLNIEVKPTKSGDQGPTTIVMRSICVENWERKK